MLAEQFNYTDERFADIQLLRYRLNEFCQLTLQQKVLVYYLSEATLWGRDIIFDQFGKYNLRIRKLLEVVFFHYKGNRNTEDFKAFETYLKRVWFSNGIHHHYGCEKIKPEFDIEFLREAVMSIDVKYFTFLKSQSIEDFLQEICPVIFNPEIMPMRVNKQDGCDLVKTSACNFYDGVTQEEVENFYNQQKTSHFSDSEPPSFGLNSTLIKTQKGEIIEDVWKIDGKYGRAIEHIVSCLGNALTVAENKAQYQYITTLINYYRTGSLEEFNKYCIEWVQEHEGRVDFVNGFIEVYGDPLGMKGSWEGIVEYKDLKATERTQTISRNAQWFENHSPIDPRFRKPEVKGVTANVVCAAMLGGDEYPSTAIGINLPNADWIRAQYGSKSVTICNLTEAYNKAAHGNGFKEEFVIDGQTIELIERYGDLCDDLHTDLHECLGHGSGQLLPGVDPNALKSYANTIEEARADLFGLYFIADYKMVDLKLIPDDQAYKSHYYTYMMNGLITQLTRIKPGRQIEEAHMRNRSLIAHWCLEKGRGLMDDGSDVVEIVHRNGKSFVRINNFEKLRHLFAQLLSEVQRIKSEGDYEAARIIVERYGVKVDSKLHEEVLERYAKLNLAPYKGFINPKMTPIKDEKGEIIDISLDYTEGYAEQMLRYSKEYGTLI